MEGLIEGLDYVVCKRCGDISSNPHRIRDAKGIFAGHIGCAEGNIEWAFALNH